MQFKKNAFTVVEITVIICIGLIIMAGIFAYTHNSKPKELNSLISPTISPEFATNITETPIISPSITPSMTSFETPNLTPTTKLKLSTPTPSIKPSPTSAIIPPTSTPPSLPTQQIFPTATPTTIPTLTNTPTSTVSSTLSCGSNYTFFDTSLVDMSKFYNIVPLGNLNPSGHVFPTDHIYFYQNTFSHVSLVAPGQATITRISASQNITAGTTDYSIYFKPCSQLEMYLLHVTSISQKLLDAFITPYQWDSTYSTGGNTYRNYGRNVSIEISSGGAIGTFYGTSNHPSFDLGAYDSRITLNFINPSARINSLHTVCPIDYFSSTLKSTLYNYFMSGNGTQRTISPICGTVDQDVTGTAQGVWLLAGTSQVSNEDPHLALVHDNLNPTYAVFSVGTSITGSGLNSGVYPFIPSTSDPWNKDFNQVVPSEIYCYQISNPPTSILIQLPSTTTLKIAKNSSDTCGTGPWSFTGNETSFQR